MILRELFEARAKSVGIIFGRFNPPHQGHRAAWEMAAENSAWYVGTNKSTQGPKDPLPYDIKVKAMQAVWPAIKGHIVSEISWLTLASKVYEKHGNIVLNVYTDEDWVTKTLVQYNGKEGQHGYYDFGTIQQQVTPRLSSATALRAAVMADDRQAFSQAAGVDADTLVAGHAFFDVVKHYLMPHAEKAAAKPVKKKVKEPVAEGTSIESTLRAIITDIGEPITNVYDTMKFQAKKYMENHGELDRGFRMVAAGIGGRWVQSMYVGKLQNELYDLCKYNTRRTVELQQFLRGVETGDELEMKRSFGSIAKDLPSILAKLGQYLDAPQLTKNANRWMQNKAAYEEYIANLELEDDYDEPAAVKAPKDTTIGQQRSQVEDIVNDVLSKLPKKIAGDIRNAIARAPNKLQALQAELKKHGAKEPVTEMDSQGYTGSRDKKSSSKYGSRDDYELGKGKEHTGKAITADKMIKAAKKAWDYATEPVDAPNMDTYKKHRAKNIANIRKNKEQGVNEFALDGFNSGDDGEEFNPEMAKMAYDEGVVKGASLADGATTQRAMAINDWDKHDGGIYSQHFAKGFIAGRKDKIRHNNRQYNLNLKLMKDGSIRHGEINEYGDTAKGQKMLGKVQKRAVDRVTSKKADTDPKYAKKNQDTANAAWERMTDKDLEEGSLGEVLPWPVVANKITSAMKAMGWKAQRKGDDAFLFSTKGAEDESQYYMVMIDNEGDGMFTYALGTFEGGRPDIGEQGKLPTTAASVSEVLMAIRDGYGLDEAVRENAWDRLQRERALESAGVGIITKQNTTVDVNKNTPKKNLKAFRLA